MRLRPVAFVRLSALVAAISLLLLAGAATAARAGTPRNCDMAQPGDAEALLTDLLNNQTPQCTNKWYSNIDPSFRSWTTGGSQNLPVIAAALGLYKSGPDANLDWYATNPPITRWNPVPNPTGYRITYVNWWIWYLASQVGEDPKVYLGASFNAPPEGRSLKYFKGTEEFSNTYDTVDAVAAVAVRYWVFRYGGQIQDQNKAIYLKDLTRKFLRTHLALYGMAAGEVPVWKYDLGWRVVPNGPPVPTRTPVPGGSKLLDTQYDPDAPRKNGNYIYNGHFLALSGTRSSLGGHWNFDYRALFFDRAIGQFGNFTFREPNPNPEYHLLNKLEALWSADQPPTNQNLYGLTAEERDSLDALLHDCYYGSGIRICPGSSQYSAAGFQGWLRDTFQPWLGNIRLATTYRVLGGNGWRASMMEQNTNGTNVYAVYYDKDALDNGTHPQATFLFPWYDNGHGVPGSCTYDPDTGRITASHPAVTVIGRRGTPRTVHPEMTSFIDISTEPRLIQLLLTPDRAPVFGSSALPKSLTNAFTPYGIASGDVAWVINRIPEGGVPQAASENWNWVEGEPRPYTEANLVHLSSPVAGIHQHFFTGATDDLPVEAGDTLYAYVYLDPANPPSEVMLQWNDGSSWEHRAYWGANLIGWGADGQESRRYMGDLPSAGDWARLEVPARLLGLEGRTINGMAFTLYNGGAAWDQAGKNSLLTQSTNLALGQAATQSSTWGGIPAANAVDGSTNGNYFSHTDYNYQAWWQVDLGAGYSLDQINIWNRTDCCAERLSNLYVLVSDQPFASTDLGATISQAGVSNYYVAGQAGRPTTVAVGRAGRYVRVQLTGTNYLSLAEVEVYGRDAAASPPPPPPPPPPATASVAWVKPSEVSWGPPNTLTVAGYAQNGTGGVQMVWRDETAGTAWNTAATLATPAADGTWSNTIASPNKCHTFRVYVNYSGARSADFVYDGVSAGYCPETATLTWIQTQASAGFGPPGSLVVAGSAKNAPAGAQVYMFYRDATAGTAWVQAPYAPAPDADGTWYSSIDGANTSHTYQVQVRYDAVTSRTCTYQANSSISWCQ